MSIAADAMLLTPRQAAQLLNVSLAYLTRLMEQGEIPTVSGELDARLRLQEVLEWQQRRRVSRRQALDALSALGQELQLE